MPSGVELYFDLASPYAYLAVARAEALLGRPVALRPVLAGAIFRARGWGSWANGPGRAAGMAEIEARAARYGLPSMRWPDGWPLNSLTAMRACLWAEEQGALEAFVARVYRHEFALGEADVLGVPALARISGAVGLDGDALAGAVGDARVKARLRALTDAAWARGVRGVPTAAVGDVLVFGDDRLEEVAALVSRAAGA